MKINLHKSEFTGAKSLSLRHFLPQSASLKVPGTRTLGKQILNPSTWQLHHPERTELEGKPHVHSDHTKSQFWLLRAFTSKTQLAQLSNSGTAHHHCWTKTRRRGMDLSHWISAIYMVGLLVWSTSRCRGWTKYRIGWDTGWRWHLPTGEAPLSNMNTAAFHTLKEAQQLRF